MHRRDPLGAVASLGEPTRRALYDFVVEAAIGSAVTGRPRPSGSSAAPPPTTSTGSPPTGCSTSTTSGCRVVRVRAPGRPAKLYRRAARDIDVTLPPRDYELAGRLLAEAADRSRVDGIDITRALDDAARAEGLPARRRDPGPLCTRAPRPATRAMRRARSARGARLRAARAIDDGTVVLRNCPFHQLAQEHTELICGMNLCLLDAAVEGVGETGLEARLEPEEGFCCVQLHEHR